MKPKYKITATCYDKRGRVISKGVNDYARSHPLQAHFAKLVGQEERIYLHAEIKAIISARGKPIHKIRVERYNHKGEQRLAFPCPVCQQAIKHAGIKLVEYTT